MSSGFFSRFLGSISLKFGVSRACVDFCTMAGRKQFLTISPSRSLLVKSGFFLFFFVALFALLRPVLPLGRSAPFPVAPLAALGLRRSAASLFCSHRALLMTTDFSLSYTLNMGTFLGYSGLYAPTGGLFPLAPAPPSSARPE